MTVTGFLVASETAMIDGNKVIAVVPARGGDHEVPYLNIKKLGSLPLIAHTLREAGQSQYIDRIIVSTDDDQVAQVALEYGAEAPFRRPKALAQDISEIKAVIRHAVETIEAQDDVRFDVVVTLQATSPFRRRRSKSMRRSASSHDNDLRRRHLTQGSPNS